MSLYKSDSLKLLFRTLLSMHLAWAFPNVTNQYPTLTVSGS